MDILIKSDKGKNRHYLRWRDRSYHPALEWPPWHGVHLVVCRRSRCNATRHLMVHRRQHWLFNSISAPAVHRHTRQLNVSIQWLTVWRNSSPPTQWVPYHNRIPGYELADAEAKTAFIAACDARMPNPYACACMAVCRGEKTGKLL